MGNPHLQSRRARITARQFSSSLGSVDSVEYCGDIVDDEHEIRALNFDWRMYLPRKRDLCFISTGILCARLDLEILLSYSSWAKESIAWAAFYMLEFIEQYTIIVGAYLGSLIPIPSDITPEIAEWIGHSVYWMRLFFGLVQIGMAASKCCSILKDFKCPMCLSESPKSIFHIGRPRNCHHYGCFGCLHKWRSSGKLYSGCAICRKRSPDVLDIVSDLCDIWQLIVLESLFICAMCFLLHIGAFDRVQRDALTLGSSVAMACFYIMHASLLGYAIVIQAVSEVMRARASRKRRKLRRQRRLQLRMQQS